MSAEHTPAPWQYYWRESESDKDEADCGIYSEQRKGHVYAVARCPRYQKQERWEADASLICRAVNAHDDLVAALKEAEAALRPFVRDLHAHSGSAHNFGVVVNGPRTDQHLITLLASDFDRATTSSSLIFDALTKAAQS